ncbi:MAG: sugar nucleotide-binding protein [Flavobacteriales bacterium]|jgi:dTDP-4-dehydrorhamnose reductase|nr:sugar nucleotide-binding protein [Flavobacteriales bacterium]
MSLKSTLVFGADSFLGSKLIKTLSERGCNVIGTTRRKNTVSNVRVFLDLSSDIDNFKVPEGVDYAYLLAGTWNYGECDTNPEAWKVNVLNMANLARKLLKQNVFITFISSNTVFGGDSPWPHENDDHNPLFTYAQHKSAGEKSIQSVAEELNAVDNFNIVRLTKILGLNTSPLPDWVDTMKKGGVLQPFLDLSFAPISVSYTAESLVEIGCKRVPGNFHISGADNVSYDEFARKLSNGLGFQSILIEPVTSISMNVHIPFKPRYSGISMERTTDLIGIKPQTIDELVLELSFQYKYPNHHI